MGITVDKNAYNRFVNLDNIEFRIIDQLAKSEGKYANNVFKILKYDTEDCLQKPDLTYAEKIDLLYKDNGNASGKRIFMSPYIDDAFEEQSSHIHIYVYSVYPQNHLTSTVNIAFETITHNKISNIYGEASIYNPDSNPSELSENGDPIIIYKSRETVLLKNLIAAINGTFVSGIGTLQFNAQMSGSDNRSRFSLWNGRKFFGHLTVMSTQISGVSDSSESGF